MGVRGTDHLCAWKSLNNSGWLFLPTVPLHQPFSQPQMLQYDCIYSWKRFAYKEANLCQLKPVFFRGEQYFKVPFSTVSSDTIQLLCCPNLVMSVSSLLFFFFPNPWLMRPGFTFKHMFFSNWFLYLSSHPNQLQVRKKRQVFFIGTVKNTGV